MIEKYEAPELRFSRSSVLKDAQGLSPLSSASLYLRTQSSTPWAMLANSRDSTFFSKYSMIAGGSVTLSDCFLRLGAMQLRLAQLSINKSNHDNYIALIISAGLTRDGRNTYNSGRYALGPGREGRCVPDRRERKSCKDVGQSEFLILCPIGPGYMRKTGSAHARYDGGSQKDNLTGVGDLISRPYTEQKVNA